MKRLEIKKTYEGRKLILSDYGKEGSITLMRSNDAVVAFSLNRKQALRVRKWLDAWLKQSGKGDAR